MAAEVDESSRGKISIFIASYRLSRVLGGVSGSGVLWRGVEPSARCPAPPITRLMYWLVTGTRVGARKHEHLHLLLPGSTPLLVLWLS